MIMLKAIVKLGTAWAETRYCIIWADRYFRLVFSKFSSHRCFPIVQVFIFARQTRSWCHGPCHLQEYEIHVARRKCFILSCMMPHTSIRGNYLSLMRHTITFCRKKSWSGKEQNMQNKSLCSTLFFIAATELQLNIISLAPSSSKPLSSSSHKVSKYQLYVKSFWLGFNWLVHGDWKCENSHTWFLRIHTCCHHHFHMSTYRLSLSTLWTFSLKSLCV